MREGDHVQAGKVIATIDDQQIRAREQQAEAAVRQAEARVELSRGIRSPCSRSSFARSRSAWTRRAPTRE